MTEPTIGKIAKSLGGRLELIPLADIFVPERYRKLYGDLGELAVSLETKGQLQNLVVCTCAEDGKNYRLLAGGRRYRTMTEKLQWQECRALVFDRELTELEMLEIEWEENNCRLDLDYKEDIAIKKRIHEIKAASGVSIGHLSGAQASSGASVRGTAAELGVSPATISQDLNLAKAHELMPELFKDCKTKKEAKRILDQALETAARDEMARRIERKAGSESQLRNIVDRYIVGDFFTHASTIPDNSIDFVECDPPYAIALAETKKLQDIRYSLENYNEVDVKVYVPFIGSIVQECYRVMSNHSWGIMWFAPDPWFEFIYNALTNAGFGTTRLTCKWVKPVGQTNQPSYYLANACEEFFYFWKGRPALVREGRTNIFNYVPVAGSRKVHPTEKPIELMQEILSTFCWEGSRILVPFAGSGVTLLAAQSLKMVAFGYDLSDTYKDSFVIRANEMFGGAQ